MLVILVMALSSPNAAKNSISPCSKVPGNTSDQLPVSSITIALCLVPSIDITCATLTTADINKAKHL